MYDIVPKKKIKEIQYSYSVGKLTMEYFELLKDALKDRITDDFHISTNFLLEPYSVIIIYDDGERVKQNKKDILYRPK